MGRVGVMSMQRIANYGSFLQAYALKTMIEELGFEVQFVDYHVGAPVVRNIDESNRKITRAFKKVSEIFCLHAPLTHKLAFIQYKRRYADKYMPLLGVTSKRNFNPTLDCLVIGSDEVFNCIQKNVNVGFSPELFGAHNNANRVITYAASFGNTTLDKLRKYEKDLEIASYLSKIDAISVRDKNSGDIVVSLIDKKPEYHLDPVLVYDYFGKCQHIPNISFNEKYLVLYAYSGRITENESEWISRYAKQRGLKIYAIGGIQKCADRFIDCSPFEVLSYFRNAEEVITDTFHGSIFSIISQRKFVTIVRKSRNNTYGNEEKITDLLKRVGLENRYVYDIKEGEEVLQKDINYHSVFDILEREREKTYLYLSENLKAKK